MSTAPELDLSSLDKDPRLFLYTSLTAGSSHTITATSRMETILKANRIPFLAVDLATDEKCRKLWQRRGGAKKKLPGLVKEGYIIGDLEEVEEWNEFGELKENIGPVPPAGSTAPPGAHTGVNIAPPLSANVTAAQGPQTKAPQTGFDKTKAVALPGAEEMAAILKAKKADEAAKATAVPAPIVAEAMTLTGDDKTSSKDEEEPKEESGDSKEEAKEEAKEDFKEESKEEAKEDSKEKAKEDSKEEAKEDSKEEAKEDSKEEAKGETKDNTKEGSKEEAKAEPKEEAMDEPVEEVKEEPKEEFKENPQEELKEESKEDLKEERKEANPAIDSNGTKQDMKEENKPSIPGVAGLQIKEETPSPKGEESKVSADEEGKTQKQEVKDPAAAGQSVED